jgi:hypothetical protein
MTNGRRAAWSIGVLLMVYLIFVTMTYLLAPPILSKHLAERSFGGPASSRPLPSEPHGVSLAVLLSVILVLRQQVADRTVALANLVVC